MSFIKDIINLLYFKKIEKKYKRIFFFENKFIENHLIPYITKNNRTDQTLIISLYKIDNSKFENYKIITIKNLFILEIFFLTLKIKYVYSSTPDLNNSIFKKSVFNKSKYIYLQHSPLSLRIIYTNKAFINFDVIFVINNFQKKDVSEINNLFSKNIKFWRKNYLFTKNQIFTKNKNHVKKILLAPTWGTDFYKNNLHYKIKEICSDLNLKLELRPHYMSYKKNEINLYKSFKDFKINDGKLNFNSIDVLVTDWSGIYLEYAFLMKKKCILINSSQKVRNNNINYKQANYLDNVARKALGYQFDPSDIEKISKKIKLLIQENLNDENEITNFFKKNFY